MVAGSRRTPWITRHWAACLLGLVSGSLVLLAAFNVLVDGYGLFGMPVHEGFNQSRRPGDMRLFKAYDVQRQPYDGLILGSSRSEIGLDPEHVTWQGYNAYNLAMPGASLHETLRYLQHAQAAHPLRRVLLGLDFVVFSGRAHWTPTFIEARLRVDADGKPQPGTFWKDALDATVSKTAFDKSLETWQASRRHEPGSHTAHGQAAHDDPFNYVLRGGGYHGVFHAIEREYLGKQGWGGRPEGDAYFQQDSTTTTLDIFRELLQFCREHHIALVMEISPIHVDLLMGLESTGMYATFEQWKRELVRINEANAALAHAEPFPLWDFAGTNDWTTDPEPDAAHDRVIDGMHWFWDAAHYRSSLGDLLQARVLGGDETPAALGERIDSSNIEAHLARQHEALRDYLAQHPGRWQAWQERFPPLRKQSGSPRRVKMP